MSILSKSSLLGALLVAATAGAQTTPGTQQPATGTTHAAGSAAHDSAGKMAGTTKSRKRRARRSTGSTGSTSASHGATHDSAAAKSSGTPK